LALRRRRGNLQACASTVRFCSIKPTNLWDELRTAFHVARDGTISAAAETLGVHRATVIRHIDGLEAALGVKLFRRHARGYALTEAGEDMLRVAGAADDAFRRLRARLREQDERLSGALAVTSIEVVSAIALEALRAFNAENPGVQTTFADGDAVLRLDYGEAQVAIRGGPRPTDRDAVVEPLGLVRSALYAHPRYVARCGPLASIDAPADHVFIGSASDRPAPPLKRWLRAAVPPESMPFRFTNSRLARDAVLAGLGVGFLPIFEAERHGGLVEMSPSRSEWDAQIWLVAPTDLRATPKVARFVAALHAAFARAGLPPFSDDA